jgi:glucose dehydrogenase
VKKRIWLSPAGLVLALLNLAPGPFGRGATGEGKEWRSYGADPGNTKYSPLDQINKRNVASLRPAWIFNTGDSSDGKQYPSRSAFEATPLMVRGVLYVVSPFHRLFALDAETGRVLWEFDTRFDRSTRVNLYINRGVSYWESGSRKRILLADQQARLFSIDALTGKPDSGFGNEGMIDLKKGITEKYPRTPYGNTSPPAICGDTVVTGSWVGDGEPRGPAGDVRAWDVRTGREMWRFHTVPRPGEFGHDTWAKDSWQDRSGVNAWSMMSVDNARGLVFLPVTSPATDFYGGDRAGANLFGDSVVALDCATGKRRWHFQTIHHDLWDYDLPSAPVLVTVRRDGKSIDAVAQITKTGFVFVLDRSTGKPLFEVEERPVPKSAIPGEHSSPTQPYPVKPPPFARQSMRMEDITDAPAETRAYCMEMIKGANVNTKLYDPISETYSVMFPGTNGGANWGGGSFDRSTGTLYVNSMDVAAFTRLVPRPPGSEIPFRTQSFDRFWDKNRYPCQKPPWGSLTAIDLNTGEHRWRVTLGEYDELTARGIPKTGASNLGGSVVTAGGLVFIGATNDGKFRAFDKDTGEEVWMTRLPASAHATPMTYIGPKSGRQFILIASGGGNKYNNEFTSELVAFALPRDGESKEPVMISAVSSKPRFRADYKGETKLADKLPDFVFFDHARHVNAKAACDSCHRLGEKREVLAKQINVGMVSCMDCHRQRQVSVGCNVCHDLGQ